AFEHRMIPQRRIAFAQRDLPRNLAPVQINGRQDRIWRRGEGKTGGAGAFTPWCEPVGVRDSHQRIRSVVLPDPVDADPTCGAHDEVPRLGIERRAAPTRASTLPRSLQRPSERRWGEERPDAEALHLFLR